MEEQEVGEAPQEQVDEPKLFKFPHCPNCGSTDRMVGRLLQKAKAMGLAREDWDACFQAISGFVLDPKKAGQVVIGQTFPAYVVRTDVCLKCGTIYAIDVQLTTARQKPAPLSVPTYGLGPPSR